MQWKYLCVAKFWQEVTELQNPIAVMWFSTNVIFQEIRWFQKARRISRMHTHQFKLVLIVKDYYRYTSTLSISTALLPSHCIFFCRYWSFDKWAATQILLLYLGSRVFFWLPVKDKIFLFSLSWSLWLTSEIKSVCSLWWKYFDFIILKWVMMRCHIWMKQHDI